MATRSPKCQRAIAFSLVQLRRPYLVLTMVTFPRVIRRNEEERKKFGKYRRNATKNNYFFLPFLTRHYFCPVTPILFWPLLNGKNSSTATSLRPHILKRHLEARVEMVKRRRQQQGPGSTASFLPSNTETPAMVHKVVKYDSI